MPIRLKFLVASFILLVSSSIIFAQETTLQFNTPVQSSLASNSTDAWTFTARDGGVVTFSVVQVSGDLDPMISIENRNGEVIISNDDYNYPGSRDALLESITIPQTGTYTVKVSAVGSTRGEYILNMLPGYGDTAFVESFADESDWTFQSDDPAPDLTISDGTATLQLEGIAQTAYAASSAVPLLRDFFVRTNFQSVSGHNGWLTGLILRRQNDERYYSFVVNNQGFWRFIKQQDGESVILRDWTGHPAIVAGEAAFTLEALANANSFDLFYNGQFIGSVLDTTEDWYDSGSVGLEISTVNAIGSSTSVTVNSMIITQPMRVDDSLVLPDQIIAGSPNTTIQSLQRHHLLPPGGDLVLAVQESSARYNQPGASRFVLARGTTYANLVIGTTITPLYSVGGVGACGLILRSVAEDNYLIAYIDSSGGYGLSWRNGDSFEPGIYGENEALQAGSHNLIITANGDTLHYYIDNIYAGSLAHEAVAGEVGNAVVNFDPVDTSCQFSNTWVWRWE